MRGGFHGKMFQTQNGKDPILRPFPFLFAFQRNSVIMLDIAIP